MEAEIAIALGASETFPPVATANPPMFNNTHAFSNGLEKRERTIFFETTAEHIEDQSARWARWLGAAPSRIVTA
jgi:hypothetical protein